MIWELRKNVFSEQQIDHKFFQNNKPATKISKNNNSTTIFLGAAKKKTQKIKKNRKNVVFEKFQKCIQLKLGPQIIRSGQKT